MRYYPQTRPARGFCGSTVPFRRKGEYFPKGRRLIPLARVSALWLQGFSTSAIAGQLGSVRGARFQVGAISKAIDTARRAGRWDMFPLRRPADDNEPDAGLDDRTVRALGL